ncbi:hypothetical protein [Paucibacter sp. DJ2R-2]|uniref:hypothetical protein n=1 Tax=Paucibacter sp. DJ2R-2 TaxID=2893558 RepID=UPI0021E3F41B|nr:hypothetical protein [Paucibacter sp. DJ2R-2]MCV2419591.1 hypothetical protein [Paucibacter sp. DJ4R-1]MCV2437506.1 hypothetical protein [Paucibacter sp. DJ2R-2]
MAGFIVATPARASRYAKRIYEPDVGQEITGLLRPFEHKGITDLEIGLLRANPDLLHDKTAAGELQMHQDPRA